MYNLSPTLYKIIYPTTNIAARRRKMSAPTCEGHLFATRILHFTNKFSIFWKLSYDQLTQILAAAHSGELAQILPEELTRLPY